MVPKIVRRKMLRHQKGLAMARRGRDDKAANFTRDYRIKFLDDGLMVLSSYKPWIGVAGKITQGVAGAAAS